MQTAINLRSNQVADPEIRQGDRKTWCLYGRLMRQSFHLYLQEQGDEASLPLPDPLQNLNANIMERKKFFVFSFWHRFSRAKQYLSLKKMAYFVLNQTSFDNIWFCISAGLKKAVSFNMSSTEEIVLPSLSPAVRHSYMRFAVEMNVPSQL